MGGRFLGMLLLTVTFVVGGLVGAAAHRVLEASSPPVPVAENSRGGCAERDRDIFATLDLSPQQRVRVDEILERRRAQADAFWQESGPRLQELTDSTRAEIRRVLTPEQRAEYDRIREERRARKKKHNNAH